MMDETVAARATPESIYAAALFAGEQNRPADTVRLLERIGGGPGLVEQAVGGLAGPGLALAQARNAGPGLPGPTGGQLHQPAAAAHVAQGHGSEMTLRPRQRVAKVSGY